MKSILFVVVLSVAVAASLLSTRVLKNSPSEKPVLASSSLPFFTAHEKIGFASTSADSAALKPVLPYKREDCMECHDDQILGFERSTHGKSWQANIRCEQCHGDLAAHIKNPTSRGNIELMKKKSALVSAETCLGCHEKAGEQKHAGLSEHTKAGVTCVTCHEAHPSQEHKTLMASKGLSAMHKGNQTELCLSCHKTEGVQFAQTTHHRLREGTMDCSSCHNPHGTDRDKQLRGDNVAVCVQCHEDKRGPFVFMHGAQLGLGDGCLSCHDSHGSPNRNMLKLGDARTLCVSCHSRESAAGVPHGRAGLQTSGDCTRCHTEIHGSNTNAFYTE